MANALALKRNMPVRVLIQGRPKTGKTGALVALVEAGFKLRMLDFDANPEPLLTFASDEALDKRVDIVQLEDKMWDSSDGVVPMGKPEAFSQALGLLKHWKYKNSDGTEVDLGKPSEWGPDTILAVDSLTSLGAAAKNRAMVMLNKTRKNSNWRVWDFAQQDIRNTVKLMASAKTRYHLVILSHPKMIGPEMPEEGDSDLEKALKTRAAAVVPTRLYPDTPGKALSPTIGAEVPIILKSEIQEYHGKMRRMFDASPTTDTDSGAPVKGMTWPQPAETALLELFKALGAYPIRGETT